MSRHATANDMRFVTSLNKNRLDDLKAGAEITARTGYSVSEMIEKATADRVKFAVRLRAEAVEATGLAVPRWRLAVSRSYYSMYHAARALCFFRHKGDDHEKHIELPKHLPKDFPAREYWENALKTARLQRNNADYLPYPIDEGSFRSTAEKQLRESAEFLPVVRGYLRSKGCTL